MNFERFTASKQWRTTEPRVTINTCGTMYLNAATCDKFSVSNFTHVILHFDSGSKTCGLELVNGSQGQLPYARKLTHFRRKGRGCAVGTCGFLRWGHIDFSKMRRAPCKPGDKPNWIHIPLAKSC